MASDSYSRLAFGPYEFDARTRRLSKYGYKLKLQPKSAALLAALLEHRGQLVDREELRKSLWPEGTFVDFDLGIKVAVKKLRDALGDSAEDPTYIVTVHGEGYRFAAPVEERSAPEVVSLPVLAPTPLIAVAAPRPRWKTLLWPVAVVLASALIAGAAWLGWRQMHPAPILRAGGGWVLITDFQNRSGNPLLDGTLEYALQRELSNSQFVKVVPRERVQDALRLMHKPIDTKIDASLGHEVMLRDGEIEAMLSGRVEKLGSTYVLTTDIVDPRGVVVAALSEEDPADSQLASAVRRLSSRVRARLGEQPSLIQQSAEKLEKVTTPSFQALQLYTQADKAVASASAEGNRTAARLLEQALREDPNFASAHLLLGYAYSNLGDTAQARPHWQRAYELADTTSDCERWFIQATYYRWILKDDAKAIDTYEALLRLYPDHYWGTNNLERIYLQHGQQQQATDLSRRLAAQRPNDVETNQKAASEILWAAIEKKHGRRLTEQDLQPARPYFDRAVALLAQQGDDVAPYAAADTVLLQGAWHWFTGQVEQTHADLVHLDRLRGQIDGDGMCGYHLTFGQLHEAENYISFASTPALCALRLSLARGDPQAARRILERPAKGWGKFALAVKAAMLARMGLVAAAEQARRQLVAETRTLPGAFGPPAAMMEVDGEIALAKGQTASGIALLEEAIPQWDVATLTFLAVHDLAAVYHRQGRLKEAMRVLERNVLNCGSPMQGNERMNNLLQLADLYREMGRVPDAEKIENDLRKELEFADSDHPIVIALRKREHATIASR